MSTTIASPTNIPHPRLTAVSPLSRKSDSLSNELSKEPSRGTANTKSTPSTSIQLLRAALLGIWFWGCACSIALLQFLGTPIYLISKHRYYAWMEFTKRSIGLLVVSMTQWFSPATVSVSGDSSVRDLITQTADGRIECHFDSRMVLLANHQLYNDWAYLWWAAYTSSPARHGAMHILLKDEIKYIPIIGTGLRLSGFVFMSRKMAVDQPRLERRLAQLNVRSESGELAPMWLLMFPEGTNMGVNGRAKSKKWAEKSGMEDYRHQLIPRSTGTYFCLRALRETVEWVYDCTIAYDGIPEGSYGQDVFPLYGVYLKGKSPNVHMHWRRFRVSDIPLEGTSEFDAWLQARWREKDELLDVHKRTGHFPSGLKQGASFKADLGLNSYGELWQIFVIWGLLLIKPMLRMASSLLP